MVTGMRKIADSVIAAWKRFFHSHTYKEISRTGQGGERKIKYRCTECGDVYTDTREWRGTDHV